MTKVNLMGDWTKSTEELKNENLIIALEELRNNADAFVSEKKNALNKAKTTLKSVRMQVSRAANFAAIVDAETKLEIAKTEHEYALKIYNKYFEEDED